MKKNLLNYKGLYGDNQQPNSDNSVHHELLATRSVVYNWEIKEHLHTDLFQLFIIGSGKGLLLLENTKIELQAPSILLIPTNTFHGFEFQSDVSGEVFTLSEQFVENVLQESPKILLEMSKARQFCFAIDSTVEWEDLSYLKNKIISELNLKESHFQLNLKSLFQLYFVGLNRNIRSIENLKEDSSNRTLNHFNNFQKLIKKTLPESKPIKEYAKELRISPVHLNRVCQSLVQKSALQYVHDYTITEAKKYLLYSSYSISEISYLLHFKDPAYFSRLFKKQTGFSAGVFRSNNKQKE